MLFIMETLTPDMLAEIAETYARLVKTFDAPRFRPEFMLYSGDMKLVLEELYGFEYDNSFNQQMYRAKRILDIANTLNLPLLHDPFDPEEYEWLVSFKDRYLPAIYEPIDGYVPKETEVVYRNPAYKGPLPLIGIIQAGLFIPMDGYEGAARSDEIVSVSFGDFLNYRKKEIEEDYKRTLFTSLFDSLHATLH